MSSFTTRPFPLLSSVTEASPWRAAFSTVLTSTVLPCRRTSPWMRCPQERPKMLIASSVRPAPIRPAMPTISPRRTCRSMPCMNARSLRCGWWACQLRTSNTVAPVHGLYHTVFADRPGAAVHGFHRAAVAQDGDLVGHPGYFVELVGDQD